ncbi:YybH family protein [Burkholderia alba]|uniref:YybH family protein n=1 Tax=Burkholderia alba TaxID=2683677 RepID=UPI002B05A9A4|nr:nuclear transport factor 2 family protein [Burkholderia alba]
MKKAKPLLGKCVTLALAGALGAAPALSVKAAETAALPLSGDPAVSAVQQQVYGVVHRHETWLNAGDASGIVDLFASENSVAEWDDKTAYAMREQKIAGYKRLFKIATFKTAFAYDAINVYGDTAVVRTHHHKGATVVENGRQVPDYNREVFVLHRIDGAWKIVLYTFNTDPVQGEG